MKISMKEFVLKCMILFACAVIVVALALLSGKKGGEGETEFSANTEDKLQEKEEAGSEQNVTSEEGTKSEQNVTSVEEPNVGENDTIKEDNGKNSDTKEEKEARPKQKIIIPKTSGGDVLVLSEQTLDKKLQLTIKKDSSQSMEALSIKRMADRKMYVGNPMNVKNSLDPIKKISIFESQRMPSGKYEQIVQLKLAHFYEIKATQDIDNFYLELVRPDEIYDTIIVVDAGHGGLNIGTYSPGNSILYEKEINLDVVMRLKSMLDQLEKKRENLLKVYYTRLGDQEVSLEERVGLANDVNATLFLSIHCNGDYNPAPYGVETLYGKGKGHSKWSRELAEIFLFKITEKTGREKRAIYRRNDLHIIRNSKVPVCICELGYLSNYDDRMYLEKKENRQVVAQGLYDGILESLMMMENAGE